MIGHLGMDAGSPSCRKAGIREEGFRERAMQPHSFPGQQLIMRSLLEQCMAESVAVSVGVRNQRPALDSSAKASL
jgi:hypothetical protein